MKEYKQQQRYNAQATIKIDKRCIQIILEDGGPTKKSYDIKMAANG